MKNKNIPNILINKTIAFTGIYPGVGKSYVKEELVKQLTFKGYKVFNTGTTQKASVGNNAMTIASFCLDPHNNWCIRAAKKGRNPIRRNTSAFFIIDEAFMIDQKELDMLKEHFPKCCFILFGDPMQFEPASGNSPITNIDLIFNLTKMMRCDQEIVNALDQIKNGKIPFDFLYKHCDNNVSDKMLVLCYKKAWSSSFSNQYGDTVGKTLYKSMKRSSFECNDETYYSVLDEVCNGDIWRLIGITKDGTPYTPTSDDVGGLGVRYELERISGERKVISVDEESFRIHFNKQNALNCHKIQGDTIRPDASDIIVWFDTGLYKNTQTFLRFLYVSISRAKSASQLHFLYEQVQEVVNSFVSNEPLFDYLKNVNKVDTDSPTLCSSDILDTIISTLSGLLPKLMKCPVYIIDTSSHLVMGQVLKTLETPAIPYQINFDNNLAIKLQTQLDSRKIMEVPGKGKNFVTINSTLDGTNCKDKVTEYNWFVLEIDHIDGIGDDNVAEYVYKNYIDSHAKHKEAKKAAFRIVYSGRRSYHFWFYVENEITNREQYKAVHKYLNDTFFGGIADDAINTPEHYVRAPGLIRKDTGKEQKLVSFKGRHTIHLETLPGCETAVGRKDDCVYATTADSSTNNLVMQAFETYKDDLPRIDGGRGKVILKKLIKEEERGFLDNNSLKELARIMCDYCGCPEKYERLVEYL